jgi:hypothetical protein
LSQTASATAPQDEASAKEEPARCRFRLNAAAPETAAAAAPSREKRNPALRTTRPSLSTVT